MAAGTYAHDGHGAGGSRDLRDLFRQRLTWLRAMPFWALSALVHLALILVLLGVIVKVHTPPREPPGPGLTFGLRQPEPARPLPPPDPTARPGFRDRARLPLPERHVEVPIVDPPNQAESDQAPPPGLPEAEGNSDVLRGLWFANSIGPAGEKPGRQRGVPGGKGNPEAGAPPGTYDAIRAALDWLVWHQSPDGSWKAAGFIDQCQHPCRNADPSPAGDGRGDPHHDTGLTGLAMLAFTGYGHTHRDGLREEYVTALRKAMAYLKAVQVPAPDPAVNGRYGGAEGEHWVYDHTIATLAMAELLVITADRISLQRSVEDAVKLCLRAQNDGFGWRYGIRPGENDSSVTGWMVLALKTARNARLAIPGEDFQRAFAGALAWFHRATASNGKCGYMAPGDEGSRLARVHPEPYPFSKEVPTMTAVSVLCRLLAGENRNAPDLKAGVRLIASHPPQWREARGRSLSTINMYYWYYASYALFQYGGEAWNAWSEAMVRTLFASQRRGFIDEDGSWDPLDEWGPAGGRVYATAISALTLEVYARARRFRGIDVLPKPKKPEEKK